MMPPKKRTDQTKRTSPTTSTSHTSADHHHLRHTGPNIGTRASVGAASSKPRPAPAHPEPTLETQKGSGEKKLLAEVSPPGARTPFTKFLYVLLSVVLLLFGWYIYGVVTLLERLTEEVGWWGIIVGDSEGMSRWGIMKRWGFGSDPSGLGRGGGRAEAEKGGDLEGSLNALADALGIAPMQVASAVKSLVPQASLTSIISKAEETDGSEVVRILFEDTTRKDWERADTTWIVEE